MVCCSAFQLGSVDHLGPAVKRLGDRYHPHLPLAVEAIEATAGDAGSLSIFTLSNYPFTVTFTTQ